MVEYTLCNQAWDRIPAPPLINSVILSQVLNLSVLQLCHLYKQRQH